MQAEEIIATGRKMINGGLVKGTWGNISMRVDNLMWITPSGVDYWDLTPEKIAVIDLTTGQQVEGNLKPSSEIPLHMKIYKALDSINGIVHTHSIYASAFAAAEKEIPCFTEDQGQIIGGAIPVAAYALPGTTQLGENVVAALKGGSYAALMAKHGLITVGRSLKEALTVAEISEKSAKIAAVLRSMGENPEGVSEEDIKEMRRTYLESYSQKSI